MKRGNCRQVLSDVFEEASSTGDANKPLQIQEKEMPSADLAKLECAVKKMEERLNQDLSAMQSQLATIQDFMKSIHQRQLTETGETE